MRLPRLSQVGNTELNQLTTKYFQLIRSKASHSLIKRKRNSGYRGKHSISPIKTPNPEVQTSVKPISTLAITPTNSFTRLDSVSPTFDKDSRDDSLSRSRLSDLSKDTPVRRTNRHRLSPFQLESSSKVRTIRRIHRQIHEHSLFGAENVRRLVPRASSDYSPV